MYPVLNFANFKCYGLDFEKKWDAFSRVAKMFSMGTEDFLRNSKALNVRADNAVKELGSLEEAS